MCRRIRASAAPPIAGGHGSSHEQHGFPRWRLVATSAVSEPETREPSEDGDGLISRVKTSTGLARQRALETLERQRIHNPLVRVAYQSYERDRRFAGGVLAGGLSYRLFLFLLPFSLFIVTAVGAVADGVQGELSDLAQNAGLSASLAASVGAAVEHLRPWHLPHRRPPPSADVGRRGGGDKDDAFDKRHRLAG